MPLNDLQSIPRIMRNKNWVFGAKLLEQWFARPATAFPNYTAPDTTSIRMDWALQFSRARSVYDDIIKERIWVNTPAQKEIAEMLQRLGLLKDTPRTFGHLSAPVLLQNADAIQFRSVKTYIALDDLTAALANFTFRVVVAGTVGPAGGGQPKYDVTIREVGIFLRDSFDFDGEQFLGMWADSPGDAFIPGTDSFGGTYTMVDNAMFRAWRDRTGKGGDFRILSDMKRLVLSPPDTFTIDSPYGVVPSPNPPLAPPAETDFLPDVPVTSPGLMLSKVSLDCYGTYHLWPLIWDENRALIGSNPNRVPVGITLKIRKKEKYTAAQIEDAQRRSPKWAEYR
jgi:hypothetical protein